MTYQQMRILFGFLMIILFSPMLWAYGIFVSEQGIMKGDRSRSLLTILNDGVDLMLQGHYEERADRLLWIIPIPNVQNLELNPVLAKAVPSSTLDELAQLTDPVFEGSCDGQPNQQQSNASQAFIGGMSSPIPVQFFNIPALEDQQFEQYLMAQNIAFSMELEALKAWALDQNIMFMVFELNTAVISSNPKDITIQVRLKSDTANTPKIYLKQLAYALSGKPSDMVFWILAQDRFRANFPTVEADFNGIKFTSEDQTDYLQNLDAQAFQQQSQKLFVEYANEINPATLTDSTLISLRSENNATFLTRLRGRLIASALRTNATTLNFRADSSNQVYQRSHRIEGFECMTAVADQQISDMDVSDMLLTEADQAIDSKEDQKINIVDGIDYDILFDDAQVSSSPKKSSSGCHQSRFIHQHFDHLGLFLLILLAFWFLYRKLDR